MMKRKCLSVLLAVGLICLVACQGLVAQEGLALYDMTFELADASEVLVHSFRHETIDLTAANGAIVQGPVSGIIAVPNTDEPRPLVVIFHGASRMGHANINARVYAGFDYLVRQLAAEGFVALSINVNANYAFMLGEPLYTDAWAFETFDAHIAALERANAGEHASHVIDLAGRVDLTQIHLIGHSRGGEIAAGLARREREAGQNRIQSIIHLATAAGTFFLFPDDPNFDPEADAAQFAQPDVPTAIILPEFDGDIVGLDGQGIFDEIFGAAQNQTFANAVFLRGAGHNFFNRMIEIDDRPNAAFSDDESTWLSREEHEEFIMHYAAAFLAAATGQREAFGTFNPAEPQPSTMFGFDVMASTYFPGVQAFAELPVNFVQSIPLQSVGHGLFNHPGVLGRPGQALELYAVAWEDRTSSVTFDVLIEDVSQAAAISLFVGIDASDVRNTMGEYQSVTLALIDRDGAEQSIVIPRGTSALFTHLGEQGQTEGFPEGEIIEFWLGYTPLGEIRVPLHDFDALDLSRLAQLSLRFDQTDAGAMMLSGIYLV